MSAVAVIGGGSWGTAIATALRRAGSDCLVLVRDSANVEALGAGRCRQLEGVARFEPVQATTDPSRLGAARLVFLAVPVGATAWALDIVGEHAGSAAAVALCAKGLAMEDGAQGLFMPELAAARLGGVPGVVFSGPSFADEVIAGLPAAVVAAGTDKGAVEAVQNSMAGGNIRVYAGYDPLGVAIGGTMKNVIAIAAGCAAGRGLGDNAKAALVTRGLAEMARFAAAAGARPESVYGLAGAGDLALSCAGPHSRNMAYGLALGEGRRPDERLAEGRHTVAALARRADALGLELPITRGVDRLVNHGADLDSVVAGLLARRAGTE